MNIIQPGKDFIIKSCQIVACVILYSSTSNTQSHIASKTRSMTNPCRLVLVRAIVGRLKSAGENDRQIVVFSPYKGQWRLLKTWENHSQLTITNCEVQYLVISSTRHSKMKKSK